MKRERDHSHTEKAETPTDPGRDKSERELPASVEEAAIADFVRSRRDRETEPHSSEVSEIMGYVPHWIVRWGIATFLIVIVALLAGTWLVKYPDVVVGVVEITSANPPAFLRARSTGKIRHLLVKDQQEVEEGQYLVVLESTADYRDVLRVRNAILSWRNRSMQSWLTNGVDADFRENFLLGTLQTEYNNLLENLRDYRRFFELRQFGNRLASLRTQINQQQEYRRLLLRQVELLETDCDLARAQNERTGELHRSGSVSEDVLEQSRSALLQKEHSLAGARLSVASADLQISQLGQTLDETYFDSIENQDRLRNDLVTARDRLFSGILDWERAHVLKAPMDGQVSMIEFWSEGQNVSVGDDVIAILPHQPSGLVGKVILPAGGTGRVTAGQTVNIKLDRYPYAEFGTLSGVVESMSLVPEEQGYVVSVAFPHGLRTSHGREIPFSQYLGGRAEIVTDDLRLFWRLLFRVRTLFGSD